MILWIVLWIPIKGYFLINNECTNCSTLFSAVWIVMQLIFCKNIERVYWTNMAQLKGFNTFLKPKLRKKIDQGLFEKFINWGTNRKNFAIFFHNYHTIIKNAVQNYLINWKLIFLLFWLFVFLLFLFFMDKYYFLSIFDT